jgi:hypothetical protein
MDGRYRFRLAGLACVAERNDTVWTVTVADVSYARSEILAEAIVEAAGGTVAADVAREAADAFEARGSTGPIAQRNKPAAMGAGEAAEPVELRLEAPALTGRASVRAAAARPGTVVRP